MIRWLIVALLAAGCIPKGKYEIAAIQLEATRTALSARTGQATTDLVQAETREAELLAEIADRQAQLDELVARSALREEDLAEHVAQQASLLTRLATLRGELTAAQEQIRKLQARKPEPERDSPWDAPPTDDPVDIAVAEMATALAAWEAADVEAAREATAHAALVSAFSPITDAGSGEVLRREGATVLRIGTDRLYQEGWTTLSPRGQQIVEQIAAALAQVSGRSVMIEGHTDNAPVHSADFPSNWDRGFLRALGVMRELQALGAPASMSVASFADTRPVVAHDSDGASKRNARVELVVRLDPDLLERYAPTPDEEEDEDDPSEGEGEDEATPTNQEKADDDAQESPWGSTERPKPPEH